MVSFSKGAVVAFLLHQASSAVAVQGALLYASEPLILQEESDDVEAKINRALAQQQSAFSAQQKTQEKELRMLLQNTVESQQERIEALHFELQQVKAAADEASGRRRSDAANTGRRMMEIEEGDDETNKAGKKGDGGHGKGKKGGHTSVCWSDPWVGDGPPSVFVDLDVVAGKTVFTNMTRTMSKKWPPVRSSFCDQSYILLMFVSFVSFCRSNFLIFPFSSCLKGKCREWIRF
jgi:hypothetical protein